MRRANDQQRVEAKVVNQLNTLRVAGGDRSAKRGALLGRRERSNKI